MSRDWTNFSDSMAWTLSELSERTMVTVSWSSVPTVYVQVTQTSEMLTVRTGGEDVLPDSETSGRLAAVGWEPPSTDPLGQRTWHSSLAWPPRFEQYEELARMCVAVFQDVHGVSSPAELEYRAWRDAEEPPEGVTYYEDELEPAEPHLVLPRLQITDSVSASPVRDS